MQHREEKYTGACSNKRETNFAIAEFFSGKDSREFRRV